MTKGKTVENMEGQRQGIFGRNYSGLGTGVEWRAMEGSSFGGQESNRCFSTGVS